MQSNPAYGIKLRKLSDSNGNAFSGFVGKLGTIDREIFARKNIRLLNFHVALFSSPRHTGSVASFLLFDVEKYLCF